MIITSEMVDTIYDTESKAYHTYESHTWSCRKFKSGSDCARCDKLSAAFDAATQTLVDFGLKASGL